MNGLGRQVSENKYSHLLISPYRRIYASSVNRVSIGSDNGSLPIRRQAII